MDERETLLFSIRMALRGVPAGFFRDLGKRRLPGDDVAEQLIAERVLQHLERAGYRIVPKPRSGPGQVP